MRQRQAHHRARDDGLAVDMELHAETGVHAADLQEPPAQRTPRQLRLAPFRKKLTASQSHDAACRVDHDELVQVVMGNNSECLEYWKFVDLTAVCPFSICPIIKDCC